jgi:hypothetical protein
MPSLGFPVGGFLGADNAVLDPTTTEDQARGLLIGLMPPGQLYDFDNPDSDMYAFFYALGQCAKYFGYDVSDRLHVEFNPATCVEKIPDWEAALNLLPGTGNARANRSTAQRQAGIVGRLRESGASTPANIRAALAPVLGYANPDDLEVLEVDRDAYRALHTYTDGSGSVALGAGDTVTRVIPVSDDGLPAAGAFVNLSIDGPAPEELVITLTAPDGTEVTWDDLSATADLTDLCLYARSEFASSNVGGNWTLSVENTGATPGDWDEGTIFVEGLGPSGLGGGIFYWGIYIDPALVNDPDLTGAFAGLTRVNLAHAFPFMVTSLEPWPDEESGTHAAIPNEAIPV